MFTQKICNRFICIEKIICLWKKNKIEIIHAHGTTFFTAFLLKCIRSKTKIIYHEHYGNRTNESIKQNIFLIICSFFFTEIIVVNYDLKSWCKKYLNCKKVTFLPNFASFNQNEKPKTELKGNYGKRIVLIANLKKPKNHFFVIKSFQETNLIALGWSLHLIGKNFHDDYSNKIETFIIDKKINDSIFIYDACSDIQNILTLANIGVLASTSEGFPVIILEYALAKLAIVSTNVGYCKTIITTNQTGLLFDPNDTNDFKNQLENCIFDEKSRIMYAENLYLHCQSNFSENIVINNLISIYSKTN